jgi:hypothetical protein
LVSQNVPLQLSKFNRGESPLAGAFRPNRLTMFDQRTNRLLRDGRSGRRPLGPSNTPRRPGLLTQPLETVQNQVKSELELELVVAPAQGRVCVVTDPFDHGRDVGVIVGDLL